VAGRDISNAMSPNNIEGRWLQAAILVRRLSKIERVAVALAYLPGALYAPRS
jgi:hypothetical protein